MYPASMKLAAEVRQGRWSAAALVVLVALVGAGGVVRLHACEPPSTSPAGIARDGQAVIATWESRVGDDTTVYVRRFADLESALTTVRTGAPVYRRRYISESEPEIVVGPTGALVVLRPHPGEHVAIPLDREGAVAGAPQHLTGCRERTSSRACFWLCRRPVANGDGFIVGDLSLYASGTSSLGLSFLDKHGRTIKYEVLPGGDVASCAMTASGAQLVVASAERRWDDAVGIHLQYRSLRDDSPLTETWLPGGTRVRALVAHGDGEALLYVDPDDHVRVALVSARDGVREVLPLPDAIDWKSADLGVSSRGLFVTWLGDGKAHVIGLGAGAGHRARRAASSPVGTRAVGVDDRCVVAWTAGGGSKLQLFSSERCP